MANSLHPPPAEFPDIQALQPLPLLVTRLRWLSRAAALTVTGVGAAVLVGWLLDIEVLKRILPDLGAMKPNTALSFVLAGLALWGVQAGAPQGLRRAARPMAAMVMLIALLTLGEHRLGWDLGIDQLLFRDSATVDSPGRMSVFAAVSFLLLGTALLFSQARRYRALVGSMTAFVLLNAIFALVGFAYDVEAFYAVRLFSGVALHTVAALVVLSAGILFNWPESRWMALLTSGGAGGVMARRLLPMALLIPLAIGWLEVRGEEANLYGKAFGDMIFVLATITFFAAVILRNAGSLNQLDTARAQALTALQSAYEALEQRVQERTAALQASEAQYRQIVELAEEGVWTIDVEEKTTFVNRRMAGMLGYTMEEMLGRSIFDFMDTEDRMSDSAGPQQVWDTLWETDFHLKRKDGGTVWALMATSPIVGADGGYEGALMLVTDISERKKVETALRESEERFRQIAETIQDIFWIREPESPAFDYVSPAYETVTGRTCESLYQNPTQFIESVHPDDQPRLIQAVTESATGGYDVEYRIFRPDGTVRWIHSRAFPVLDETGRLYRIIGLGQDITARKQAEARLEEERQLLQTVIDNQLDYVFVKDMEGRFILNNAAHLRSLGKTAAEVRGRHSSDLYPPELAAIFEADDEDVLHTGKVIINQEQQSLGERGEIRWVLTTKVPLRDANGNINGLVGISRDITERKQAQARLDEERRLLRAVIDNLPDYIFVKDSEGRFTLSNVAHAASVGMTAEGIIGKHARDLYAPEMAASFVADDAAVMQGGEVVVNQERRTVGSDGLPRWVLTTKVPLWDGSGNISGLVGLSRDITQRRYAQEALRESEARFRAMNEASPLGVFLTDADGKCVYVNTLHQQITGQSFAESLNVGWSEVVHPDDRETVLNRWFEAVRGKTLYQSEHRLLKSDGTLAWVSQKAAAIYDGEMLLGYVGTVEDVSERVAAEEAVRKQEALYRLLAQNLPNSAVLLFDHDLRYLVAEGPALTPFGFSKENMEGRTLWEVAPNDAEALASLYRRALAGEVFSFDWQAKDYYYEVQGLPVKNPDGSIFAGMLLIQDISERKAAEANRSRLAAIVEASYDPILSTDMEGVITSWNGGAQHLYGYTADEMIGQSISRIVPRELPQEVPDILGRIGRGERVESYETVRVRKDGQNVAVAVTISPLRNGGGRVIGTSAIHRDINERKIAEQQRLELQLERGKVDMLARFVGDASHDLKTPLTIIKSSLYLLEKQTDPAKRQRHLGNINKETQRMETLLDEMLTMSWLDVTPGAREAQAQDVNALVRRVVEQRLVVAESKDQQFDFYPQEKLPPVLAFGPDLEKALGQIVDNALSYTPEGGRIQVETAVDDHLVKITVTDTGIGIAPEDVPHIFERFWRADKARGTKAGGTGLGLAIAQKIVEDHGGRIEVESRVGDGSIFTIWMTAVVE